MSRHLVGISRPGFRGHSALVDISRHLVDIRRHLVDFFCPEFSVSLGISRQYNNTMNDSTKLKPVDAIQDKNAVEVKTNLMLRAR